MRFLRSSLLGIFQACISVVLAAATASTSAETTLPTPVITFDSFLHGIDNTSIFQNLGASQYFHFNATVSVDIQDVLLVDYNNFKKIAVLRDPSPTANVVPPTTTVSLTVNQLTSQQGWDITLANVGRIFDDQENGNILYFNVTWNYTTYTGSSYSGPFTFANSFSEVATPGRFNDEQALFNETFSSSSSAGIAIQSQSQTSATSTATLATGTDTTAKKSASGHKGLKGGAIAGIVVGLVVGLAVLGLVWFFCSRRHRSSRGYSSPLHARSTGVGVGVGVGVVPPSGREDDDAGVVTNVGVGVAAGLADGVNAEKSRAAGITSSVSERNGGDNSPYSDDFDSVSERRASVPVISGQVAALIEEGMTPEDVARLAAEELELDAAIQMANRNRAAADTTAHP